MSVQILVPQLGESINEATVSRWLKKEGEPVKVGEPVVALETEKVNLEVGATQSGVLARIERQEGEDVKIGEVLGVIDEAGPEAPPVEAPAGPAVAQPAQPTTRPPDYSTTRPSAQPTPPEVTPVAKRLAQEMGVDLTKITGAGPGGRITKEDVQAYTEKQEPERPAQPPPVGATLAVAPSGTGALQKTPPAPTTVAHRREERVRMSRRRRTIAQRLVEAQHTAAMLTTFNEIDLNKVMDIRARRKETFKERHGVGLGFMSFFVKASIGALKAFPQLNAELDGEEIVLKHYYDIGIAVGAEEGLVVPVLRDADRLSFADIEKTAKRFVEKAKNNTLTLEDLRGGTFTITNGGVFGSLLSTPILNPPQVGILGLHKIEERPIALNGQVVIRPMMYVALSYDHRLVDGREAVQFLVKVKELIEEPETLLLEG